MIRTYVDTTGRASKLRSISRETQFVLTVRVDREERGRLEATDYDGTCRLELIFIDPAFQRQGLATRLIARLRDELPASTVAPMTLTEDARALHAALWDEYGRPTTT